MKQWKIGLAILMVMLSGWGIRGQSLAGPVIPPPGGGGGGGGGNSQGVSLGSGYDNSGSHGSNHGWANASGSILPTQMSSGFWFEPAGNLESDNVGWLTVNISAQGDFVPDDGTITPEMGQLAQNPLRTGGDFQINEITVEKDGETYIYYFEQGLSVSWHGQGSFYIDPEGVKHRGYLDADVWLNGGAFVDVRPHLELNEWQGEGPRPEWLSDWSANFHFAGLVTPTSVTVVPEPATAVLFAIGGATTLWRRKKSRDRNLIA